MIMVWKYVIYFGLSVLFFWGFLPEFITTVVTAAVMLLNADGIARDWELYGKLIGFLGFLAIIAALLLLMKIAEFITNPLATDET